MLLLAALAFSSGLRQTCAQAVRESFATDPIGTGRFIQGTANTESRFTYNPAAQNLTAVLDVDASSATYLSGLIAPVTERADASFSVRFRVEAADDQEHPAVFVGLLTDRHVGDFGDGLALVLSLANGIPVANADIESFDQSYSGSGVVLKLQTEYLAIGRYRAASRQFAVELFTGAGFTNLMGYSTVTLPPNRTLLMNRVGLQNAGAREIDSAVGSLTLTVDDLFSPANNSRQISIADTTVIEGDIGTTNATFTLSVAPASSLPITVNFATEDGTALAGADYQARSGTITFDPGSTSATLTIPILGDTLFEPAEAFKVNLSSPVDATLAKGTALGTILDNDPRPVLGITDAAVLEGDSGRTNLEFRVTLSAPSGDFVTVDFTTADGTAKASDLDYVPASGRLTFFPGETLNRVLVPVQGDTRSESDETFALVLSNPSNAALPRAQATGTIYDDDSGGRLSINDVSLPEGNSGNTPFIFTVSLTRPTSQTVSVDYAAVSGTAAVGIDFLAASGTLTFPPGTVSATLTVFVIGDTQPEFDETFSVNLSNFKNATIAKASGAGTIRNDDAFPKVTVGDVSLAEGNAGTSLAVFPIQLSASVDQTVTVDYATADGTAVAPVDYLPRTGQVTFAPGTTTQTVSVPVNGDTLNEPAETFFLNLSHPILATLGREQGTATILNDDPLPSITIGDTDVLEGDSGTTPAVFTIRLSAASAQPVSVSYTTTLDGTARGGTDFVGSFGTLTIPPGQTSQTLSIPVIGDTTFEADETFFVKLSNPVQAILSVDQATGIIRNDDAPPQMVIDDVLVTEMPGETNAVFTVTLSKPSTQAPVTVRFGTDDGSAVAGLDYRPASGTLTFAPGVTRQTISVRILGDGLHEDDETFLVNLSSPTNAVLGRAEGVATILDNDPLPRISIRDAQILESDAGTTALVFKVELDKPAGVLVTANFATSDGTATAASGDYVPATGQVRLNPGSTNATVTVAVNGDLLPESDESLSLDLSQVVNASPGLLHATGTILDDDTRKLSVSDATVTEGAAGTTTNAVFTISLNKPSADPVFVRYATADGTASAGSDYLPTNGDIVLPPGTLSREISVTVIGDNVFEPDETFFVNLIDPSNAILGRPQGLGTIVNDEESLAIVPAGLTVVAENCAPGNGAIDPGETVTVSFALVNVGTIPSTNLVATLLESGGITPLSAAQAYGSLPGKGAPVSRTFSLRAEGECGQSLNAILQLQNGGTNYGNVSFGFTLGASVDGVMVCCNSADLAVTAAGVPNSVVVNHPVTYTVQVMNRGPKTASDVRMTNVFRAPVTVVSATSSQGTCQSQVNGVICDLGTLAAGASASLNISVAPQKVGSLIAVFYAKAAENDPVPKDNTASVATLVNPPPGLSIDSVQVVEGDSGTTNAIFTVHLSPPTGREVKVDYATSDGTALAGPDYAATAGTLTLPPGTGSATISIPILGDTIREADESFMVTLSNPVNALLASEQIRGTGIILDDDFVTLSIDNVTVAEPVSGTQTDATFTLRLTAPSDRPITVDFVTADGTARAPGDYQARSGQAAFAPGVTAANVTVPVLADTLAEAEETFFLNLSNPVAVRLLRTQAQGTIVDSSSSALPQIRISNVSVVEGMAHTTTNAVFTLTLSRPSSLPVTVEYATANGTAFGGSDFVIASGIVTFLPGAASTSVSITVNGDDTPELDEKFSLRLSNPSNATLGAATLQADGIIVNDDYLPRVLSGGARLLVENCLPANQAIDPLETVTVNFSLLNRGLGPTTNLTATLLAAGQVQPLSSPQSYGALPTNGTSATRPFTFMIDGACGQKYSAALELRDGGYAVGTIPFEFTLGALTNGQYLCCSSADLGVTVLPSPEPVALGSPLTYQITITNRGPSVATEVLLTNKLSAAVQSLSSSLSALACSNLPDQLVCSLPSIGPGESLTLTNIVLPGSLGDLFNFVLVGAKENDPVPADNLAVAASKVVPPTGLSVNDITIVEGDQRHIESLLVRLWPPRSQVVTVEFDLQNGTALAGQDYTANFGTLTFPPGATSTNLSVEILGDVNNEPDETFFVTLANPVNALIARGTGMVTILDDDPPLISINDVAVNVGTNGSAVAVLTVRLSSLPRKPVSVEFSTVNGTANAGTDYEAQRGVLNFPLGTQSLSIRIPIAGNTSDEGSEQFYVDLANPREAAIARNRGVVTITDEAPVDLAVSNASGAESNAGPAFALFTVTLRRAIEHGVTVEFFTADGTARAGSDYVSTNGTLFFPPGVIEAQVKVALLNDAISEPAETFSLNLTNALNGVIRNGTGIGTITDDDPQPCLSIGDISVVEGNSGTNSAFMPLRLSAPSSAVITVQVSYADCQSSPGASLPPQVVAFAPGQLEQTAAIPIVGDLVHEPNENCLVVLSNPLNASICRGEGFLTVIDDDPLPGLEISDVTVVEGNSGTSSANFRVTLAGMTRQAVTVQFSTTDGSATVAGADYLARAGVLTFAPGMTSTNLTITINGDLDLESDENFFVDLSAPVNASIFKARGIGTILNDDSPPQAECPAAVVLATPGNQTCFQPLAPIALTANIEGSAAEVERMEFYAGSILLGIDTTSPYSIVWEGAQVGDYCITAKAICKSGRTVSSPANCLGVTDSGAAIAIVRNFDDPEIAQLREYLLEIGYCARVFDQAGLTAEALSSYQLVIWDDLGADGLSDATVQVLQQVFISNIPLYLIGDRLVSPLASLSAPNRAAWSSLSHLTAQGGLSVPGQITFSTETRDRQPGSILTGRFANIEDLAYLNAVSLGKVSSDATSLATAHGADLFVQYPDADTTDNGQARVVSQSFRVLTGGDEAAVGNRKALFQNTICWLLRCSFCTLVNLSLEASEMPAGVKVGDEFTFNLAVSNNGECIASATIVTNRLPPGLSLVRVSYNQGTSADYRAEDRTLVWRVGSVVSGTENNAIIEITVRAVQPGHFQGIACGVANYERLDESNCAEYELDISGTSVPAPPSLALLRVAYGLYQLQLTGASGASYQIQASRDLRTWQALTNAPGPIFYIELPELARPGAGDKYFRARWP